MKKIITLMMAVTLVASAAAQVKFDGRSTMSNRVLSQEKVSTKSKTGFAKNRIAPKALGNLITSQPEGARPPSCATRLISCTGNCPQPSPPSAATRQPLATTLTIT